MPAPLDHPKTLVVQGFYRYVRNPMYVGLVLVLIGEVLFLRSIPLFWYSALWFAIINVVILFYEEPYLSARFGESYERYRKNVGRWLPGRPYTEVPTESDT